MVNVNLLKGAMAEQGKSQRDVADMLGISERTFYNKMKRKVFDSDEIVQMCNYLGISENRMLSIFLRTMSLYK